MEDRNIFYVFESELLAISHGKLKQVTRFSRNNYDGSFTGTAVIVQQVKNI